MRGCILTCDQNGCNEAQWLDSQHVAVISGGVVVSLIIINIAGFHIIHHCIISGGTESCRCECISSNYLISQSVCLSTKCEAPIGFFISCYFLIGFKLEPVPPDHQNSHLMGIRPCSSPKLD